MPSPPTSSHDILEGVHPTLVWAIKEIIQQFANLQKPIRVTQGLRTAEYQHQLWRQGREIPGPHASPADPLGQTVTNCDGYIKKSNHQKRADGYGHAVDVAFVGADPYLEHDPEADKWWNLYGAKVEGYGLKWGGRFPKVDRPHCELA